MVRKTKSKEEPDITRSVDLKKGIKLLKKQIKRAEELLANRPIITSDHTAWNNTTRDYLIKTFGSKSPNVNAVIHASSSKGLFMGMGDVEFEKYMASIIENQIKMLGSCIEQLETEIELSEGEEEIDEQNIHKEISFSNKVFIVHGRNQGIKEAVARFVEKLGLEAVILHEKPSKGRTIIEKFSDYSDVHFAIVLLTADDIGKEKDSSGDFKPRVRQNVIFELGYFIGKLGRSRVCALYEEGVEIPSDYKGVIFIQLDTQERWRYDIVRELLAAGFNVDANKIFSAGSA
ncbi:MAG: nucleotide-binding protein [Candidatus Atribacteria bacterium]|nr:nucleotide-binding protein [Candidatus Atribacteria bacterium]